MYLKKDATTYSPEKIDKENVRARQKELEIEETKKELLNEGDK